MGKGDRSMAIPKRSGKAHQRARRERYVKAFINSRSAAAFKILDHDQDGYLGSRDLQVGVISRSASKHCKSISEIMFEVDEHQGGQLGPVQVLEMMARMQTSTARAVGTGTNVLRALIEFTMFDTNELNYLDKYSVQQMLYVYYGITGATLDLKTPAFMQGADQIDLCRFIETMNKLQLVCDMPADAFITPAFKPSIATRLTSLGAALHSSRLVKRMEAQLPKKSLRSAALLKTGSLTDRSSHRAAMKERRFKAMSTIIQGELEIEKRQAVAYDSEHQLLPPLLQVAKGKPPLQLTPLCKREPKPPSTVAGSIRYHRRASISGEDGRLELVSEAPSLAKTEELPNTPETSQVAHTTLQPLQTAR